MNYLNYQNPYMGYGNQYQPNYQNYQAPTQSNQNVQTNINNAPKISQLQGKTVDSVDVVKATDIPLDGSISYFPISNGSAIVTKQLLLDGTSKITVYKPVEDTESTETPKYITAEELDKKLKDYDLKGLHDDLEDLSENFEKFKKEIKKKVD